MELSDQIVFIQCKFLLLQCTLPHSCGGQQAPINQFVSFAQLYFFTAADDYISGICNTQSSQQMLKTTQLTNILANFRCTQTLKNNKYQQVEKGTVIIYGNRQSDSQKCSSVIIIYQFVCSTFLSPLLNNYLYLFHSSSVHLHSATVNLSAKCKVILWQLKRWPQTR